MLDPCRNQLSKRAFLPALLVFTGLAIGIGSAQDLKPKLGPDAITVQQSHAYLRGHDAPDYWALSPYYVPQATDSACSVAAITMLLNALRALPPNSVDPLVTQRALLEKVANDQWAKETAQGGSGVTWDEFVADVRASLRLRPRSGRRCPNAAGRIRRDLGTGPAHANRERTERPGHHSRLFRSRGADRRLGWPAQLADRKLRLASYDADLRRVLIMDVDRQWYIPYWSSDDKLLAAMIRQAPSDMGGLAGQTGGLIRVTLKTDR